MRSWRDDLPLVLAFYSRLPVPRGRRGRLLADAVWIVPAAAVLIALPAALAMAGAIWLGASPLAAAVVAVAGLVATTGALHEDGLADCADGFWGGATPERRLEIMRDSRIGTYGVLALLLAVLLKVALLQMALAAGPLAAAILLVSAAVAGRTLALYPWVGLPPARSDGLAVGNGRPTGTTFRAALLIGAALTLLMMAFVGVMAAIFGLVAAAFAAVGVARVADRSVGGHTGDVLGAAVVAADLAYLAAAAMWLAG